MRSRSRLAYSPVLIIGLMVAACSPRMQAPISGESIRIFPEPPDTTKIQYLTKITGSSDVSGRRTGFMAYVLGDEQNFVIQKPYGIAATAGRIYVCDTQLAGLEIIDLETSSFEYFVPGGFGKLQIPTNVFVDSDGLVYVSDIGRREIVVFSPEKRFVASFGDPASIRPSDVFVQDDEVFVTDMENHTVIVYSTETRDLLYTFEAVAPDTPPYLYSPTNIYVRNGLVYVTDFGDFTIKVFTKDGDFVRSLGGYGTNPGQFVRPKGLAVDREDNLFVVDAGFENVQIFDAQGRILMFFGGAYAAPGDMWLPAKIIVDYENLDYFQDYVYEGFNLLYLIYVTNQFGPDKISIYGFVEPK